MKLKTIIKIFAIIAIVSIIQSLNINAAGNWNPSSITTATPGTSVPGLLEDNFNALENVLDTAAPTALLINGAKIKAGTVPLAALAANSVNSSKVVDNSLTSSDLAPHSVTASKLDNDAVTTDKIDSQAVTSDKILDGTIAAADLSSAVQSDIDEWESGGTMSGALKIHVYTPDKLTLTPYSDTRTYVKNQMNDAGSGVNWYYDIMLGNTDPAKDVIAMRWWIDGNNEMSLYDSYLDVKNNKISNLAAGSAGTDAANIGQLVATNNLALLKSGGTMTGNLAFFSGAGFKITGLGAGTAGTDAANITQIKAMTNNVLANAKTYTDLATNAVLAAASDKSYVDAATNAVGATWDSRWLNRNGGASAYMKGALWSDDIVLESDKIWFGNSDTHSYMTAANPLYGGFKFYDYGRSTMTFYRDMLWWDQPVAITNVATPTVPSGAATKAYVDNATNYFQAHGGKILNNVEVDGTITYRAIGIEMMDTGGVGTTFNLGQNITTISSTGDAYTITTITGGKIGVYTFLFTDSFITIANDDTHAADTIDLLGSSNFTSADDTVLQLMYDGTSWYEISRSVN